MALYYCQPKRLSRLARMDAELAAAQAALKEAKDFESALLAYNDLRNRRDQDAADDKHPDLPGLWSRWLKEPGVDPKTQESIPGIIETLIKAEGLEPAEGVTEGCIAPWYCDGEMDEADGAREVAAKRGHLVKNHGDGKLTYNQVRRAIWGVEQKRESAKLADLEAVVVIRAAMTEAPLGAVIDRPEVAEAYVRLADAPAPTKESEAAFLSGYEVAQPLVEELRPAGDAWDCTGIPEKIPGWSPTNAYVGTVKDLQTSGALWVNWTDNTVKHAMVFTTGSAYTIAGWSFQLIVTGTLATGEITCRIYAGDPTGAQTTLASGTISVLELTSTGIHLWFGGGTTALANATVYTLELTTTAPVDVSNYISIRSITTGGAAGNQQWTYSAGAWAAQGANRLNFVTADNSNGGSFLWRADANVSTAATIKGAAVHTSDTGTVTMGATLTHDAANSILQRRAGDAVTGSTPAYAAQKTGYRYGNFVFSAGVTTTFAGDPTVTNSGLLSNPLSADASSKGSTLTLNGTSASPCVFTNSVGAYNANNKWTIQMNYGNTDINHASMLWHGAQLWYGISPSTSYSTLGHSIKNLSSRGGAGTNLIVITSLGVTIDLPLRVWFWTPTITGANIGIHCPQMLGLVSGGVIENIGYKVITGAATDAFTPIYNAEANATPGAIYGSATAAFADIRQTQVVPTGLALADLVTNGELKATITNRGSYAATDMLIIAKDDGTVVWRGTMSRYDAAYDQKPANCAVIAGLTNDTLYTMKAKASSDNYVESAYGSTATGTPTAPSVTPPSAPTLTVARLSDTSVRATVDGDASVTNYVYYSGDWGATWTEGGNRSGDGTVDISGLTSARAYLFYAQSVTGAGCWSPASNVTAFVTGPASGAVGRYATFLSELNAWCQTSSALAAKVTDSLPARHVMLGRRIYKGADAATRATIIAAGPVLEIYPATQEWSGRSADTAISTVGIRLVIHEAIDSSATDTLVNPINFVDALRQELLSESDGSSPSAFTRCENVRISVEGPGESADVVNEVVSVITITAELTEAV